MTERLPPPKLEDYAAVERLALEASGAQMRQAQADTPLRPMPVVILSHSRDLPNPFGFPPDLPVDALERAPGSSTAAVYCDGGSTRNISHARPVAGVRYR